MPQHQTLYYREIYDDIMNSISQEGPDLFYECMPIQERWIEEDNDTKKIHIYREIIEMLRRNSSSIRYISKTIEKLQWINGEPHWGNRKRAWRTDSNGVVKIKQFPIEWYYMYMFKDTDLINLRVHDDKAHLDALLDRLYIKDGKPFFKINDKPAGSMSKGKIVISHSYDGRQKRFLWKKIKHLVASSNRYFYFMIDADGNHVHDYSSNVSSLLHTGYKFLFVFDTQTNKSFTKGE